VEDEMGLMTRHYETLTAHERFALTIEAMARRDDVEADRLADSCPRFLYRSEDAEFRDRMKRAYSIAATVCLNMRAGLAQIRMAEKFRELHRHFAGPVAQVAIAAFLCGRAHGHAEAKLPVGPLPSNSVALAEDLISDTGLQDQLPEIREVAEEAVLQMADTLHYAVGESVAENLLSQWDGFGTFCIDVLRMEPVTLTRALGLGVDDPLIEIHAVYPDICPDSLRSSRWTAEWKRSWASRFHS
jgi:hypothetical protein